MAEERALGAAYKKCHLDHQQPLNNTAAAAAAAAAKPILADESVSALPPPPSSVSEIPPAATTANLCMACRKRVGLTGFRCRCGSTYCGVHRYPENHGCGFDYKKAGREQIQRQNPVVVAEKLQKI